MTECISTKLSFSSLERQEIVANFCGGRLTSDVTTSVRLVVLYLSSSYPYRQLFIGLVARLAPG